MKVTVAICTWNRAALLNQTLQSMRTLRIPEDVTWELLVVNNNCTDDTDEVIARHAGHLPIVRLFEPRPGKSYAANLATERAAGDLLICTDDDVVVHPDWLAAYVAAARRFPEMHYFVGLIDPIFEVEPPKWIRRHLAKLRCVFVIVNHGPIARELKHGEGIFGANMAFRAEVARAFPLNGDIGRIEDQLLGAEDTDMIERVRKAGFRGMWVPGASLRHFNPASRMTTRYISKWFHDAGRGYARMHPIGDVPHVAGLPRWVIREYVQQRIKACVWRPTRNARWFDSYKQALMLRGMLDELRAMRTAYDRTCVR